jgi:hypothetical protein
MFLMMGPQQTILVENGNDLVAWAAVIVPAIAVLGAVLLKWWLGRE